VEATRFTTAMKKADQDLQQTARSKSSSSKRTLTNLDRFAPKITFVLFDEITENSPVQSRTRIFDVDHYPEDKELYESIKARGVITPIVIRDLNTVQSGIQKRGERAFALIAGHRRIEAAKLAGLKGVPGILARDEDDHDLMTLAENMGRRELSSYERAVAIHSLKEGRGFTIRKTAGATGLSSTTVARMISAFSAPEKLQEMWKNGSLTVTTLEVLKKHWDKFEGDLSKTTLAKVEKISKGDAKDLCAQLDTGTELEPALQSIGIIEQVKAKLETTSINTQKNQTASTASKGDKTFKSEQKEAIIKALRGVFPKIKAGQLNTLFDLAIANNAKDIEVLWAAALYVSRGGKLDRALGDTLKMLQDRRIRSLLAREVKLMRQVSSQLQSLKRGDKEVKHFLQAIFAGS